ncbi:MAG: class I SAM-dependent methyltransferase [Gammaproteobacteria bacterium]
MKACAGLKIANTKMKHPDEYFEKTRERKRHPLLVSAINCIKDIKSKKHYRQKLDVLRAADLGCGSGGDTLYLLEEGYDVTAVDIEEAALNIVSQRAYSENLPSPKLICGRMEELKSSVQFDLISSNLALPYVGPVHFLKIWSKIVQYIRFGGVFSGQFFGNAHEWSKDKSIKFLDIATLKFLFRGWFSMAHISEEKGRAISSLGGAPYWHQYDVIAVRTPIAPEKPLLKYYEFKQLSEKADSTEAEDSEIKPTPSKLKCKRLGIYTLHS